MKRLTIHKGLTLKTVLGKFPLCPTEKHYVTKSILRSLLLDIERLRPGTKGLGRDLITLEARLENEGASFLATNLCTLGKAVESGLEWGMFVCPKGFKRPKGSKNPSLLMGIFDDVFDRTTGFLKDRDCEGDLHLLRQLLFFLEEVRSRDCTRREA